MSFCRNSTRSLPGMPSCRRRYRGGNLNSQKFVAASKEYAELGPLVEAIAEWRKAERELKDAEAIAADPDMRAMAEEEARR